MTAVRFAFRPAKGYAAPRRAAPRRAAPRRAH